MFLVLTSWVEKGKVSLATAVVAARSLDEAKHTHSRQLITEYRLSAATAVHSYAYPFNG